MSEKNLLKVTTEEISEFNRLQNTIIENAVEKILKVHKPDHLDGNIKETMQSGMRFTVETLASIMSVSIPEMIDQQLLWGKDYLPTVGISIDMVLRNFEIIAEATGELMPKKDYPGIYAWLEMVIAKQREMIK